MTQQSRALATLTEELSPFPSSHMKRHLAAYSPYSECAPMGHTTASIHT